MEHRRGRSQRDRTSRARSALRRCGSARRQGRRRHERRLAGGATAVGWIEITTRGDAGARGHPTIRVRTAGAPGFAPAVAVPTSGHANRFFRPYVAFMGATPQLIYQRKARIAGFSVIAPIEIRALNATAFGPPRVLEKRAGQYLAALPLAGGRL